jgi:hypothetical protein
VSNPTAWNDSFKEVSGLFLHAPRVRLPAVIGCDATAILALTKKIIPTNEKGVIELVLLSSIGCGWDRRFSARRKL